MSWIIRFMEWWGSSLLSPADEEVSLQVYIGYDLLGNRYD